KRVIVIDGRYRVVVFFWRMIPRWLWERLPIKN
ncbi:oxidoreductase, partial [Bacteroides cellulosilyticus]